MHSIARTFIWALCMGCTVGAPAGFSSGDQWTFPLVGPLEDGLLVTPARVHGHGPYLFAIDPDANVTALDEEVVRTAHLASGIGPKRVDESDTGQSRFYAEMLDLEVGGLTIGRRDAMVFSAGFYDTEGRRISGIIGRDVLADSLVFGFDRDQGIATLSTVKAFKAPPGATVMAYENVFGRSNVADRDKDKDRVGAGLADVTPMPRRLVTARIGDASFAMHLDLGATVSQLRQDSWRKAKLASTDVKLRLVDEAMTARDVTTAGRADRVMIGGVSSRALFAPYIEKRFLPAPVDGALGLDFFRPYAVYASWDSTSYLLKPRGDAAATTTARLGRWGSALPACPHPGCVALALVPVGDGVALDVVRDPEAANKDLEILVGLAAVEGQPALRLVAELPRAVDRVAGVLPGDYRGATPAVLDVSPFPRDCGDGAGCIVPLAADAVVGFAAPLRSPGATAMQASAPAARVPVAPPIIAIDKLHRRTGDLAIPPPAAAQGGPPVAVAIVKLCLGVEGKVESTRLIKSSNVAAYDDELQATIKATWTFDPVEINGAPAAACAQVTFLPR